MNPDQNLNTNIPVGRLRYLISRFSSGERLAFFVFTTICVVTGVYNIFKLNNKYLIEVPAKGGALVEGMIGSARFINPVLAISDTDKSISNLIYSGLLKSTNNGYKNDLAESYNVSEDGLVYDIRIKANAVFQDGKPVTSDDIIFTIKKALDSIVKSPKRANWEGVNVEKVSDTEIRFTLKKAYFPFLENLTLGILPKHIWQEVSSEEFAFSTYNLSPIGSGPYKIDSIKKNASGLPTDIVLKAFNKYISQEAYISNIELMFFANENLALDALNSGAIQSLGGVSAANKDQLNSNANAIAYPMPRIFGAFFNQNQAPIFANKEVRIALDTAIDKNALTQEILKGYGIPLSGPTTKDTWQEIPTTTDLITNAKSILTNAGWKLNADSIMEKKAKTGVTTLSFSISTSDVPDLKRTAEILRDTWTKIGVKVDIKIFDSSDLNQNVIKPRKYDVLLFGEVIGKNLDLYPFWHSSERNDPGLNISLYTSITVDKLLEDMQGVNTEEEKQQKIDLFKQEIKKDLPAIFLYSPEYIYVVAPNVKNVTYPSLGNPSDRFESVTDWYIKTAKKWSLNKNQ